MEIQDVFPANGKDFKLAELKSFVGGYIDILNLNDRQIMVVSEEGKLMGLPRNLVASEAFYLARGIQETIVGDVLICNVEQVKP